MKTQGSFVGRLFGANAAKRRGRDSSGGFRWREFGRHYLKAIVWILVLTAVVHVMEISGVLKGFEMAGLDTFLRLNVRQMSQRVVIVEISNEDYRDPELFDGRSPLKNDQLIELATAVRNYHPAAIGMDFDTASPEWCRVNQSVLTQLLAGAGSAGDNTRPSPIVWAEVPDNIEEPLKLAPVLGGRFRDLDDVGVPRFPVDSDGLVRRYESEFRVSGGLGDCAEQPPANPLGKPESSSKATYRDGGSKVAMSETGLVPSFARAVLHRACEDPNLNCASLHQELDRPVIFNFYGDRYRFPIIQAHEFIGPSAKALSLDQNIRNRRETLLRDKIVLIGGNFKAARDVYMTPLGEMAGVELIALAIESDFSGGIREARKWLEKLADFIVGSLIVLVYFYYRRRPRLAMAISLIGVPVVAVNFSLLLFRSAAYWFNFVPIIIGMIMHQMLELSESCGELQEEVHKLERELHELRENTAGSAPKPAKQIVSPGQALQTEEKLPPVDGKP